jgi:hypothetical protein
VAPRPGDRGEGKSQCQKIKVSSETPDSIIMPGGGEYPIQIEATQAKSSWIKFFVLGLLNTSMGGTTASAEDGISRWPSVVVVNRLGQERRLEKLESNDEAEVRAERVQADLEILGLEAWCEKYDVPLAFARA